MARDLSVSEGGVSGGGANNTVLLSDLPLLEKRGELRPKDKPTQANVSLGHTPLVSGE